MERLRRTMMFVPGSNAAMLRDAPLYGADSIMFDLEDAVSLKEKDSARVLVHFALKTFDYSNVETVVRINGLDTTGALDIEAVVLAGVNVVRLPKTETAQDIVDVDEIITRVERENNIPVGRTKMMAAIESAEGVLNAREIAKASDRLIGIALGAEDYVTNMKTRRYPDGQELFFARSMILHAARAAGIAAIDTVYSNVDNMDGFREEVERIKQLGFDGNLLLILVKFLWLIKFMHQQKKKFKTLKKLFGEFVKLKLKVQVLSQLTVKWSINQSWNVLSA